jgi:hypothetical protein
MEWYVIGFGHALMAKDIDPLAFQFLWDLIFGLFDHTLIEALLTGTHLSEAFSAHRTIDIGLDVFTKTFTVYEMATIHWYMIFYGVF